MLISVVKMGNVKHSLQKTGVAGKSICFQQKKYTL